MSKINDLDFSEHAVAYPSSEKAYALVMADKIPFSKAVVGVTYPSVNYSINRRADAEMTVFEYVLAGEGRIFLDGQWKVASAGDFYILAEGEAHRYKASPTDPWKKLWINYTAGYMPSFLASYGVKSGIYRAEGVRELFEELISLTHSDADRTKTAYDIADKINQIVKAASVCILATPDYKHSLRRRIDSYVHKKLDLDSLAAEVHMSKSNLIRTFKREYGITPYEYLLDIKIETAKALLKDTNLSVKEVAEKLAISDEHYFSSMFLKRTGSRPGKYRRLHSAEDSENASGG